jgi:hypothetical protein
MFVPYIIYVSANPDPPRSHLNRAEDSDFSTVAASPGIQIEQRRPDIHTDALGHLFEPAVGVLAGIG